MRWMTNSLSLALIVLICGFAGTRQTSAQETSPQPANQVVSLEIVIADLVISDQEVEEELPDAVVQRIRESEKQGKLSRVTRLRLTTLSNQQAMAQFGERVAVSSGRQIFAGGREFPGGGRGSGNIAESYVYQNVGTMAQITPRVEGNRVIMECNVEQSRLVPKGGAKPTAAGNPSDAPERSSYPPDSIETITARSTVQVKSGQSVLLTSRQQQSGAEGLRTYILVTGTIQGE